jgi:hypothetical protein
MCDCARKAHLYDVIRSDTSIDPKLLEATVDEWWERWFPGQDPSRLRLGLEKHAEALHNVAAPEGASSAPLHTSGAEAQKAATVSQAPNSLVVAQKKSGKSRQRNTWAARTL